MSGRQTTFPSLVVEHDVGSWTSVLTHVPPDRFSQRFGVYSASSTKESLYLVPPLMKQSKWTLCIVLHLKRKPHVNGKHIVFIICVEWRQLPWLQPSEAEAWFEARGATWTKWLLMVRLYKWLSERGYISLVFPCWPNAVAEQQMMTFISPCQRRLVLMKRDKSHQVSRYSTAQSSK